MYRLSLGILFSVLSLSASAQKVTDTFKLYFDLNVPTLSEKMERKIDLLIYNDKIINGSGVTIVGYADFLGSEAYNKGLSMKRAENVKNYLVSYGIRPNDIKVCIGKGKIDRDGPKDKTGYPIDRRVDIVMNNRTEAPNLTDKPKVKRTAKPDTIKKVSIASIDEVGKLKAGSVFKLNKVYFPPNSHMMKTESYPTLEKLYTVLRDKPHIKISIEGHVCCINDEPDALDMDTNELTLSVNRAKAIYSYLIKKGIDPTRLTYVGFGRSRPEVMFEQSEEDAERNRRVEIRIVENK